MGHADEVRAKRLSKDEQNLIVEKLSAGVTKERIIHDARASRVSDGKNVERINVIKRGRNPSINIVT